MSISLLGSGAPTMVLGGFTMHRISGETNSNNYTLYYKLIT